MTDQRPLILFTNDDGIQSPGLWAAAEVFADVGDILVVAPRLQQSGMGRSLPVTSEGRIHEQRMTFAGKDYTVYAVDGTPAQAVQHGVFELAPRTPSLIVSGINYGENAGSGVTISGTVGAALEGASLGIPSLAVSQRTQHDLHLTYSREVDFTVAAHFTRMFGLWLMNNNRPEDVDLLKLDIPLNATIDTPWRVTRLSRSRVYWPTRPERAALSDIGRLGYKLHLDASKSEPDSDVYAVLHEGVVSVTPMSLDMTSRTDLFRMRQLFTGDAEAANEPVPAETRVKKPRAKRVRQA